MQFNSTVSNEICNNRDNVRYFVSDKPCQQTQNQSNSALKNLIRKLLLPFNSKCSLFKRSYIFQSSPK